MDYAANLNRAVCHTVNRYVGERRENQLSPSLHPTTDASEVGEIFEALAPLENGLCHAPRCFRVVALDAVANAF